MSRRGFPSPRGIAVTSTDRGGAAWTTSSSADRPRGLPHLPRLHELRRARAAARTPGRWPRRRAGRSSSRRSSRASTSSTRPTSTPTAPARRSSAARSRDFARRDEVVIATKVHCRDAPGPERRRPVAQGDHDRDRRQPAPARHRLRRPLPDPSLGLRHADRGDARGAARRREGRQGALHRRVVDVRLAVRQGALHLPSATAGRGSSRCRTTTTCSTARRSARCCRSASTEGIGVHPVEPAGARAADARLGRGSTATGDSDEVGQDALHATVDADRAIVERSQTSPSSAACRARRSRWPGCAASRP